MEAAAPIEKKEKVKYPVKFNSPLNNDFIDHFARFHMQEFQPAFFTEFSKSKTRLSGSKNLEYTTVPFVANEHMHKSVGQGIVRKM